MNNLIIGLARMCSVFERPDRDSLRSVGIGVKRNCKDVSLKVYRKPCIGDAITSGAMCKYIDSDLIEIYEYESEDVVRLNDAEKLNFHIRNSHAFLELAGRISQTNRFVDVQLLRRLDRALSEVGFFRCASLGVELKGGRVCKFNFYFFPVDRKADGLHRGMTDPGPVEVALHKAGVSNLNEGLWGRIAPGGVRIVSCAFSQDGEPVFKVYVGYDCLIANELFGGLEGFEKTRKYNPCMLSFVATGDAPDRSAVYFKPFPAQQKLDAVA